MARSVTGVARVTGIPAVAEVLLAKGSQSLLLSRHVDVSTNREGDDIEEDHPGGLGKELLRESQGERRADPRDLHDLPEAHADGGADLVVSSSTSNESHCHEIHRVLNRCNLVGTMLVKGPGWLL